MDKQVLYYARDWQAGTFVGGSTGLDALTNISAYNHPALVPLHNATPSASYTGPQLLLGQGGATTTGAWVSVPSTGGPASPNQVGVAVVVNVTGSLSLPLPLGTVQAVVQFNGNLVFDQGYHSDDNFLRNDFIHNGVLAGIGYTNPATTLANVDTYRGRPQAVIPLDGAARTLTITHSGLINPGASVVGAPQNVSGATMAGLTSVSLRPIPTSPTVAVYLLTALTTTTYGIRQSAQAAPGSPLNFSTNVGTTFNTGTTYTGTAIAGITLLVTGPLTPGDSAMFYVDQMWLAIESITLYSGSSGNASYISPVFDGGQIQTAWQYLEWTKNPPFSGEILPTVAVLTGDTLVAGAIVGGATSTLPVAQITLPQAGTTMAGVGLQAAARGRYAQFTFTFSALNTAAVWIRDLGAYYWLPTPQAHLPVLNKLLLPPGCTIGPLMQAYVGMLCTFLADQTQREYDLIGSYGIPTSVDQYLLAYGMDLGLVPFPGEDPIAYRARISAALKSRQGAGSLGFIAEQVALFLSGVDPGLPPVVVVAAIATATALAAGSGGSTQVIVSQTGAGQAFTVAIPPTPWPALATLINGGDTSVAKAAITAFVQNVLTPANSVLTLPLTFN